MTQQYPQEETASPLSIILIVICILIMLVWNIFYGKKVSKPDTESEPSKIEYRNKLVEEGRFAYV